jgi:pyrroloquinoline quinone (PQQ) biosynthesis protein C
VEQVTQTLATIPEHVITNLNSVTPMEALMLRYEAVSVADHPFFQRLRTEPFNAGVLWLLLVNIHEGARDFVMWLADLTARIGDNRIRSVLAKQLNDELGDGDFTRIHAVLFDQLLAGIECWRPPQFVDEMIQPGRNLGLGLTAQFLSPDPYQGVGAAMVTEIYAKKFDLCVGSEMRRQNDIKPEALTWLNVHEQLELEHAADSHNLALLIPDQGSAPKAVQHGAEATWHIFWVFLDDLHRLCFEAPPSMR